MIRFGEPRIGPAERREVDAVLRSGWIGPGPRAVRFEAAIGRYLGAPHTVAVSSGTAALHLALVAAGVGRGDEVVTTPLTFAATANAILLAGATPVFADVDRATQNLDPAAAARAVSRRTRALLPVHLGGRPCAMGELGVLARARGLLLVEDASHAVEARLGARHAGTIGAFGCFSFTHNKNLTTGEGGAVVASTARAAATVRRLANQGLPDNAWNRLRRGAKSPAAVVTPGFKYAMPDLNAAIGLRQLPLIERWWRRRRALWEGYTERLRGLPLVLPSAEVPGGRHALHLFTVHLELERLGRTRDEIRGDLAARGIGSGVHYLALHLHPWYRSAYGLRPDAFPNARWISERTLSLPLAPHLTDAQAERVTDVLRAVLRRAEKRR